MNADLKVIGERLKKIRNHLHLLQKDFAKEVGISASSLCDIEAGKIKPRFELIYALTKKYNINIFYLLHGTGDMFVREEWDILPKSEILDKDRDWWKKFVYYFENSPMIRYTIMSHFLEYINEKGDSIKVDIEKNKENI